MPRKSKFSPSVYSIMKDMTVDEKKTFPYEQWNACRSAASYLAWKVDRSYYVTKSSKVGEEGDIVVTRTL